MLVNLQIRHALKFVDTLILLACATLTQVEDSIINDYGPNFMLGYQVQNIVITSTSETTATIDATLGDDTILFTYAVQLIPGRDWAIVPKDITTLVKECVLSIEADMCATAALVSRRSNESKIRSAHNYVRYHPTRKEKRDSRRRGRYRATRT